MQPIYVPGTSPLHNLHPLTKLTATALVIVAIYLLPWLLAPTALFGLLLALARLSGVADRFLRTSLRVLLPITLSLFIIQGILFPPPGSTALSIGPVVLPREGLAFAFLTSTRLLAFTGTFLLLLQTTHPADLVFALTERGLPRSIGYILLVSLQIIPDMSARATAILEAQRSRGLETQGGLRRARALAPLVGPLVVGALVDVEERAMAIESRAFLANTPKTTLRDLIDTPAERIARWVMVFSLIALVVGRIALVFLT